MSVVLRKLVKQDIPKIMEYLNNPSMREFLPDDLPIYTIEKTQRFYEYAVEDFPLNCAICFNGDFAGIILLKEKRGIYKNNLEVGYWVAQKFWNKGIASAAIEQITRTAFLQPEINRVYADVFKKNIASHKALLKAGYTHEATLIDAICKNGVSNDCLIFSKRK